MLNFFFFIHYIKRINRMSILETKFSYQYPPISVNQTKANDSNWISTQPSSGSTFHSDGSSTIISKVDSYRGFMRLNSCYLKYTVTATTSGNPAVTNTSSFTQAGLASVIQSVTVRIGN